MTLETPHWFHAFLGDFRAPNARTVHLAHIEPFNGPEGPLEGFWTALVDEVVLQGDVGYGDRVLVDGRGLQPVIVEVLERSDRELWGYAFVYTGDAAPDDEIEAVCRVVLRAFRDLGVPVGAVEPWFLVVAVEPVTDMVALSAQVADLVERSSPWAFQAISEGRIRMIRAVV